MHRDRNISILSSLHQEQAWPDGQDCILSTSDFEKITAQLPSDVLLLASPVTDCMSEIDSAERVLVRNAVQKRQAEFSTGRLLALMAIESLGVPPRAILRGPMNEPLWPEGITGSISHTSDICLVAVVASGKMAGLGIDVESSHAEVAEVERLILRPDERNTCPGVGASKQDAVRLIFSAKESLYKAVHGRAGRFIDFQEVRIEFQEDSNRLKATAPDDAQLDMLISGGVGRYVVTPDLIFVIWCG